MAALAACRATAPAATPLRRLESDARRSGLSAADSRFPATAALRRRPANIAGRLAAYRPPRPPMMDSILDDLGSNVDAAAESSTDLAVSAAGCCWVLLGAAGCCWVLLGAVGCCWLGVQLSTRHASSLSCHCCNSPLMELCTARNNRWPCRLLLGFLAAHVPLPLLPRRARSWHMPICRCPTLLRRRQQSRQPSSRRC